MATVRPAPIILAARQTVDGALKTVRSTFRRTTTAAADLRTRTGIEPKTRTRIAAAAGVPIAAGIGIGVGSYAGLRGVSSGLREVGSGGKAATGSLLFGLFVLIILIAVIAFAYTKVKDA